MSARQEIIGLQYLRGFAAVAVVVCHAKGTAEQGKYFDSGLLGFVLDAGQIGADLFFVISGFIITVVSLDGPAMAPAVRRRDFFARRFARIVPMMWIAILSYAALRIAGRGFADWPGYVNAFFLLPHGPLLPQTMWTLRQELIFYLLFALTMLAPVRRIWILGLWAGLSFLLVVALEAMMRFGWAAREDVMTPAMVTVRVLLSSAALEFVAGMAIAAVWMRRGGAIGFRLPVDPFWVLALLVFADMLLFAGIVEAAVSNWVRLVLLVPALALTVWVGVHAVCPPGVARALGLVLGNASYSIYLFHPHLLSPLLSIWSKLAPATPMWLVVTVASLLSVLLGVVVHYLVEKPVVRVSRRLLDRRRASSPALGAAH